MSAERVREDADRWLRQARDDLEAAEALIAVGKCAQAAFLAQQAGEKALKAHWFGRDLDPWGHSLTRLIRDLPAGLSAELAPLLDAALALDKLYIPTRYPDALAGLTPGEAFTRAEARAAADHARAVIEWIAALAESGAPD